MNDHSINDIRNKLYSIEVFSVVVSRAHKRKLTKPSDSNFISLSSVLSVAHRQKVNSLDFEIQAFSYVSAADVVCAPKIESYIDSLRCPPTVLPRAIFIFNRNPISF